MRVQAADASREGTYMPGCRAQVLLKQGLIVARTSPITLSRRPAVSASPRVLEHLAKAMLVRTLRTKGVGAISGRGGGDRPAVRVETAREPGRDPSLVD